MSDLVTQRISLVGRQKERTSIARAIAGQGPQILFIEGIAGIGKTTLLEKAGQMAQEQGALCPPIVDFYDIEMHAHRALEATIALSLDPDKRAFHEYWAHREQVERTLLPGRKTLKEQEQELWRLFLKKYADAAEEQRLLLRFDTAELLEYERDSEEVLADCDVSPQDAPSWEWLLERIGDLKNTAILIAARPTETGLLKQRLLDTHKERVFPLELKGFTLEETEAYFRAIAFGKQVADESPEMLGKVHLLTEGRPILIALALDWLERGMWERHIYPTGLEELKAWKEKAQAEEDSGQLGEAWRQWDEVRRSFEIALVQQIRSLDHTGLDMAVKYAALCRKGCNAELLARLMEIPQEEKVEELVKQLLTISFVKPARGLSQLFFLHDEMYYLVEKYIWQVDWPDYSEQTRLDGIIIDWYTEQIEDLSRRIPEESDLSKRSELRRQQQLLYTERLYYQFDKDPRYGYQEYTHLDEEAIASRELEWDHLLRNEGLWFTRTRGLRLIERGPTIQRNGKIIRNPTIDYDCRRRWVWRYIAQNELKKAVRVAEKLLAKPYDHDEPELWRGGVQVAMATALAYQGGAYTEAALQHFQEGIHKLEAVPQDHKEPWLYPYFLGTAHLYQGLALRNWLRLGEAAENYETAISLFRGIDHKPRMAESLNNLAYIYARQGKLKEGKEACEQALKIRKELADEYSQGLSLNTLGIIYERMDQPLEAIRYSQEAMALFQKIGSERGIILAEINLGRSYRRKGRSLEWGRLDEDFQTGQRYLAYAIALQEEQGADADIFYRIEAQNELGCLYRDWVATLYEQCRLTTEVAQGYLDQAEGHLLVAVFLTSGEKPVSAQNLIQYADCMEDLARVYYWRGRLGLPVGQYGQQESKESPYEVERVILDRVVEEVEKSGQEKWEEIDLILGKVHVQYARLERETGTPKSTAEHYARAAGLLERYSLDAPELHKAISDVSTWLMSLTSAQVQEIVDTMAITLQKEKLGSMRLRGTINTVVHALHRVHWPGAVNQEAAHG